MRRARGAARGNENDNRAVLLEIVRLRAERAALLGYDTPRRVHHLRRDGRLPRGRARPARRARRAGRRATRGASRPRCRRSSTPEPSRSRSRRTTGRSTPRRSARPSTTSTARALRPWFEAERVLQDGVFRAATELYGITLHRARRSVGLPPRRAGVRDPQRGRLGARPVHPRPLHARHQARRRVDELDRLAVAPARHRSRSSSTTSTFPSPRRACPTLLTLDEVTTLFHEFGHALHGLFATVTYPHFAGTNVFRDFVEFPSQVNEMWIYWPEILDAYARHVDTGEPLPREVVEKLHASEAFNQGFATSEYLAASWLDQAWHSLTAEQAAADIDVAEFEAAALADIGLDNPAVPTRYSSTYFAHVFSGGYSAGYYSYIWSEVLDADTVEWFRENGGLHARERRPLPRAPARRRRLEGSARGVPRLPRAGCRHPAAARASRARRLSRQGANPQSSSSSRAKARVRRRGPRAPRRRRSARLRRAARTPAGRGRTRARATPGSRASWRWMNTAAGTSTGGHRTGLVGALVVRPERGADRLVTQ